MKEYALGKQTWWTEPSLSLLITAIIIQWTNELHELRRNVIPYSGISPAGQGCSPAPTLQPRTRLTQTAALLQPPPLPAHLGSPSHCQRRSLSIPPTLWRQREPPYISPERRPRRSKPIQKQWRKGACAVVDLTSESALFPLPLLPVGWESGVTWCVRR